jgi:hypothetical protein
MPPRCAAWHIDITAAQITLSVRSTLATAPWPLCMTPAQRIHSHYERTLADLPCAVYRGRLHLRSREWFCRNQGWTAPAIAQHTSHAMPQTTK